MKKILSLLVITTLIFSGCSNSSEPETTATDSTTTIGMEPIAAPVSSEPASTTTPAQVPVTDAGTIMPASPSPAPVPQGTATAPGMNPPHGQPGHRCDIAVGAPLNSPPSNPAAAPTPAPGAVVTTPSFSTTPMAPVTAPPATPTPPPSGTPTTTTAPGMNPPHGQPGHDCSIAVGAPLKK